MKKKIFTLKALINESAKKVAINGNEYVYLAYVCKKAREKGIELGKALEFFKENSEDFEIFIDKSKVPGVVYVRVIAEKPSGRTSIPTTSSRRDSRGGTFIHLKDWAWLGYDINEIMEQLCKMARKENWDYKNGLPKFPRFPILFLYLVYTFFRLQSQKKIEYSMDGKWAAWNTGLVNSRMEPIIALFEKNKPGAISEWKFYKFVVEGVMDGKILCRNFKGSFERATYTENPADLCYDMSLGAPILDIQHIIKRLDRIPARFWETYAPQGFVTKDTTVMTKQEKYAYFQSLRDAIENSSTAYYKIKCAFDSALSLTMKQIALDDRTAVPMYYPEEDRLCLILPLRLIDENVDVALVVKRTDAGKYEGATILTLDMAYADSRVVRCPNIDWLVTGDIPGTRESLV